MIPAADGEGIANIRATMGGRHRELRSGVAGATEQFAGERRAEMVRETLGQDRGGVCTAFEATSPMHRDRHDDIEIAAGEPFSLLRPNQFCNAQGQRLAAGVLHPQQPVAEQAVVFAQPDRFIEPQFDASTARAELSRRLAGDRCGALAAGCTAEIRHAPQAFIAKGSPSVGVELRAAAEAGRRVEEVERGGAETAEQSPAGRRQSNHVVTRC